MHQQIFDREGRSYTISISENEPLLLVRLYDRHTLIGEARCTRESASTFLLRDISIANSAILSSSDRRAMLLRKIAGYQTTPINYRGRGLGSALLKCLIDRVRANGAHHMYGKVFRQDIENNPNLLQWYQKHGFEIRESMPDDEEDVVAQIHLTM